MHVYKMIPMLLLCCTAGLAQLSPDPYSVTWSRADQPQLLTTNTLIGSGTYLISNTVMSAGGTQVLSGGVGAALLVGTTASNLVYGCTVTDSANGKCFAVVQLPTGTASLMVQSGTIQLLLTQGTTRVYYPALTYQWVKPLR